MPITDKQAAKLAAQIEAGDIELTELPADEWPAITKRGRGRPSLSKAGKSPQITIRVSPQLRGQIAARADAEGVKASEVTRRILEQHFARVAAAKSRARRAVR